MPKYRRKDVDLPDFDITAQQWNKPGDVPRWAFGVATECHDGGFEISNGQVALIGRPGDYLFKREDGKPGIIRKEFFERYYTRLDDFPTAREYAKDMSVMKSLSAGTRLIDRLGIIPFKVPPISQQCDVRDMMVFNNMLFCSTDKGIFRLDEQRQVMVHVPLTYNEEPST